MKIFISGGCKNGKSTLAQRLTKHLGEDRPLYYVATMIPHDEEDYARIQRHLQERDGWGFTTMECGNGISEHLTGRDENGAYLVDSVTAQLANAMFREDGSFDSKAPEQVAADLNAFAEKVRDVVFVSDYIYADAARYSEYTLMYMQGLAHVDQALVQVCDAVYECCAGTVTVHKGEWIL